MRSWNILDPRHSSKMPFKISESGLLGPRTLISRISSVILDCRRTFTNNLIPCLLLFSFCSLFNQCRQTDKVWKNSLLIVPVSQSVKIVFGPYTVEKLHLIMGTWNIFTSLFERGNEVLYNLYWTTLVKLSGWNLEVTKASKCQKTGHLSSGKFLYFTLGRCIHTA